MQIAIAKMAEDHIANARKCGIELVLRAGQELRDARDWHADVVFDVRAFALLRVRYMFTQRPQLRGLRFGLGDYGIAGERLLDRIAQRIFELRLQRGFRCGIVRLDKRVPGMTRKRVC